MQIRDCRISGRRWRRTTLFLLLALPLTFTTGCAKRYAVVDGEETITIKKSVISNLYEDVKDLTKALEDCQAKQK